VSGVGVAGSETRRPARELTWTPTFVAFLAYVCIMLTARLHVATAVMALGLMMLFVQREPLRVPRFLWLFAAWIAWASIGFLTTRYPDRVWDSITEHGKLVLVTLVAVNALRTATQVRYFLLFVLVSYLLFPARSALVGYVTGNTLFGRAIGPIPYENPNDLAALTILMLGPAFAVWAGAARGSLLRWVGLAGAAPLIVIIVLTQSRGALVALVAIALPSAVALARRRPRTVIAFAALVGLALYLAPATFWTRMQGLGKATSVATIGEMDPEGSARARFAVLQTATRMVQDHPMLGVGLGAYGLANAHYTPALGNLDTHNTYLNILAETGFPGLVLFLALVTSVLRYAHAARRRAIRAFPAQSEMLRWLLFGLVGYLIAGLFGSYARLSFPYLFLALLWCASRILWAQCLPASATQPPPAPIPSGSRRRWGDWSPIG
jgi:O-antigen ligase